ncbi:cytochrome-c peroxidase [Pedobacter glucosidilyticus]|uniref:cytochrome-c peroxidase n=1 Tax=Pedobacter glucosidilyticus TaxID=1122941 RepID=UPI0026F0252A|nr:cytochrome c peroxidase [Pedobacter glucosidilyticus]
MLKYFKIWCFLSILLGFMVMGFRPENKALALSETYKENLTKFQKTANLLQQTAKKGSSHEIKNLFINLRTDYKTLECIVEYYYPKTAAKLNGPPLPESEPSEPEVIIYPTGLQVLEAYVYDDLTDDNRELILTEISNIKTAIEYLILNAESLKFKDEEVFEALKLQLFRIATKGLAGFDSPLANTAISEIRTNLEAIHSLMLNYPYNDEVTVKIKAAIGFINTTTLDFNEFNRAVFLTVYLNPLAETFEAYQKQNHIADVTEQRLTDYRKWNLFAKNIFQADYLAPEDNKNADTLQIALGKMLFYETALSSNGKRSCASCHHPDKAFTDALALNQSLDGETVLARNTPTLLHAGLNPVQFYDSRVAFLEDQIHDVVSNRTEMDGNLETISLRLKEKNHYLSAFKKAYGAKPSPSFIKKALASYVRSLVFLNSSFDHYMQGEKEALNTQELAGFNLFMGKGKCGSCHFLPLFSGTVPPLFEKMESEVLGVPANTDTINAKIDADLGKYNLYKIPHQKHAFKTPSLRNIALTAPYMHNGVYQTLDEVVDFYNKGGGAGLGIILENQTLSPDKLQLSETEKKQLIAFLNALTDKAVY